MKTRHILPAALLMLLPAMADAQVVVNEFCASNDTLEVMGQTCDWIELYNAGVEAVNLKGYALSDNPKKPQKYVINNDVMIYPGCFKMVLCNGLGTDLNTSFRLSADGSEFVVFADPSGNVIDEIAIPTLNRDYSYGRIADGGASWGTFDISTPGETNSAQMPLTPMPVINKRAGFYTQTLSVGITCPDPNAVIHYTTTGTEPVESSVTYTKPISVSSTKVLRAMAVAPGMKPSKIATATYFINCRKLDLPIVCITTDRKNFYDNKIGIYVAGTNGVAGPCTDGQRRNWHQDWERPIHVEYFDKNKKLQLSQDAGIKITGSCSRNNDMKSLRIIARKEYGDNRLRYKFFDKKDITEFKSIVLRNGGNDFGGTMIRDGLVTGLAGESLNVDVQAFQPAAVFLNGEYLGLHNIREKVSTHFVEENYGPNSDEIDLLENKWTVIDGKNAEFSSLMAFVKNNSLANQANFDKVAAQIDIDNFIDYWCAQIYIDNEDWPNNNIKFYKPRGQNAKWRWVMFGAEFSCGVYGGRPDVNSIHHDIDANTGRLGSSDWGGLLMRKLLQNEAFKNKFIQRMSYVIDHTYNPDRVYEFADSLRSLMYNEWGNHYKKYYGWINQGDWSNRINSLIDWFNNRPGYCREHVRQYFGLSGSHNVEVSADNNAVKFSVNGTMPTANISGKYFGGATLEISAKLPEGLAIDHWEVGGSSSHAEQVFGFEDIWNYYDEGNAPAQDWKTAASAPSGFKAG
ncbi:MAG: CotH kinase family protein, partial [Bacteroidales bacterium]|nr:CotH kinase family protein [Bacteroidales bacterium]